MSLSNQVIVMYERLFNIYDSLSLIKKIHLDLISENLGTMSIFSVLALNKPSCLYTMTLRTNIKSD